MRQQSTESLPRVPTGPLDHELRVAVRQDGPVPTLELQSWRYSLESGTWVREEGPPVIQVHLVANLCELLTKRAKAVAEASLFAPLTAGER